MVNFVSQGEFLGNEGVRVDFFSDLEEELKFVFYTSLANIFNKCYEKAVFMKNN